MKPRAGAAMVRRLRSGRRTERPDQRLPASVRGSADRHRELLTEMPHPLGRDRADGRQSDEVLRHADRVPPAAAAAGRAHRGKCCARCSRLDEAGDRCARPRKERSDMSGKPNRSRHSATARGTSSAAPISASGCAGCAPPGRASTGPSGRRSPRPAGSPSSCRRTQGGLGLGLREVAAIAEEVGRILLPEPFVDAGVQSGRVRCARLPEQRASEESCSRMSVRAHDRRSRVAGTARASSKPAQIADSDARKASGS